MNGVSRSIQRSFTTTDQIETVTDPLGRIQQYQFDAAGRTTKASTPDGLSSSSTFDAFGFLTNVHRDSSSIGLATQYQFGLGGRMQKVTAPTGATLEYTYDANGLPGTVKDVRGTTGYRYTSHGQVEQIDLPAGGSVLFSYDPEGQIKTMKDPVGNEITFSYDGLGRPDRIQNATGNVIEYDYDRVGNLTTSNYVAAARLNESSMRCT